MTPVHPSTGCSYLCKAPVHEQFRACDVAAVVGCKEHHGARNFFRLSEPAERNRGGDHLGALLSGFRRRKTSATRGAGQFTSFGVKNQDRKSTRLNSSHRTISYAVFCLKKKKKKQIT